MKRTLYRLQLLTSALRTAGDAIESVALPWGILQSTGSLLSIGGFALFSHLPWVILPPLLGRTLRQNGQEGQAGLPRAPPSIGPRRAHNPVLVGRMGFLPHRFRNLRPRHPPSLLRLLAGRLDDPRPLGAPKPQRKARHSWKRRFAGGFPAGRLPRLSLWDKSDAPRRGSPFGWSARAGSVSERRGEEGERRNPV